MTVFELIEELKKMPQDLLVVDICEPIEGIKLNDEFYLGDSCNPNVEPIQVVEII